MLKLVQTGDGLALTKSGQYFLFLSDTVRWLNRPKAITGLYLRWSKLIV